MSEGELPVEREVGFLARAHLLHGNLVALEVLTPHSVASRSAGEKPVLCKNGTCMRPKATG